jgi:hypothetical protein
MARSAATFTSAMQQPPFHPSIWNGRKPGRSTGLPAYR